MNVYDPYLVDKLSSFFRKWNPDVPLQLGGYELKVKNVELEFKDLDPLESPDEKFLFEFVSPTTFRRTLNEKSFNYPLPDPVMTFHSIFRKLNLDLPVTISKMENMRKELQEDSDLFID